MESKSNKVQLFFSCLESTLLRNRKMHNFALNDESFTVSNILLVDISQNRGEAVGVALSVMTWRRGYGRYLTCLKIMHFKVACVHVYSHCIHNIYSLSVFPMRIMQGSLGFNKTTGEQKPIQRKCRDNINNIMFTLMSM